MARMIPTVLNDKCRSPGEREIFRRLQNDPATEDWTVIHSLNIAQHVTQIEGEIDFVAIVPEKGVLCIEVKASHHISREDGVWYFGDDSDGDERGPFVQVDDAKFSLREIVSRFDDLREVPFFSMVIFPYCEFSAGSIEWQPWQLMAQTEFIGASLGERLLGKLDDARADFAESFAWFECSSRIPSREQCDAITRLLRSDFEFYEPAELRDERLQQELKHFTDEQIRVIDNLDANPRLLVTGPAGSGKTFMAVEAARRADAAGKRTLFLCYNHLLGEWIKQECAELSHVTCRTFHAHLMELTDAVIPEGDDRKVQHFWDIGLPTKAISTLALDEDHAYDELIVDEAQDLLRPIWLECLDLLVQGGLAAGRWRMFADFDGQDIYAGEGEIHGEQLLAAAMSQKPLLLSLRNNCRNTPRVACLPHRFAGLDPDYDDVLRPDNGLRPVLKFWRNDGAQRRALVRLLAELRDRHLRLGDIVVLSTHSVRNCVANSIDKEPWCKRLQPYRDAGDDTVRYTSIQSFKGLEAPVIVLTDMKEIDSDKARSLLYIGMTRAVEHLVMFVHRDAKERMIEALNAR